MSPHQDTDSQHDASTAANLETEASHTSTSALQDDITPSKNALVDAEYVQTTEEKGAPRTGDAVLGKVENGHDEPAIHEQPAFRQPEANSANSANTTHNPIAGGDHGLSSTMQSDDAGRVTPMSEHMETGDLYSVTPPMGEMPTMTSNVSPSASATRLEDDAPKDNNALPFRPSQVPDKGKGAFANSSELAPTRLLINTEQQQGHEQMPNEVSEDSRSEIESIMGQFDEGMGAPGVTEIMSPRLDLAGSSLSSPIAHPPRKSSLEPLQTQGLESFSREPATESKTLQSPPPRTSSLGAGSPHPNDRTHRPASITSPRNQNHPIFKPPPLEPDPEPDLPFDFHRFLEQLRHKTADPVARFLRSFLSEFGKKNWMVHEQVKIISDFLEFISRKMAQCEVWRTVSDAEFDNAKEGMEKLVMNRLYTQTFSPEIPAAEQAGLKGRRHRGPPSPDMPGRRGQHQEDVERDDVLAQKVRIYSWVKEEHLDIASLGEKGRKFLSLAQQELSKINSYRAPRDKVICILNCCKVIFGFLRNQKTDQSADSFVPILIFTVLQANPGHLVSNVQYILRFRNQDKLGGEAGYYISSLMGAVQFIENLDRTSLNISDEEFEKNVEAAVSAIAERHHEQEAALAPTAGGESSAQQRRTSPHMHLSEKSAPSRAEVTARHSTEAERAVPRRAGSGRAPQAQGVVSSSPEDDAVTGLLKTIQKPLSTIGRIFSDDNTSANPQPAITPQPGSTPRRSPAERQRSAQQMEQVQQLSAADAAARQASAETEEARKLQIQEHKVVVETLAGMFPTLDRDVIDDVVRMKEGRVGLAVDSCLALTNTS